MNIKQLCKIQAGSFDVEPPKRRASDSMDVLFKNVEDYERIEDSYHNLKTSYKALKDEYQDYISKSEETVEDLRLANQNIDELFSQKEKAEGIIKRLNSVIENLRDQLDNVADISISCNGDECEVEGEQISQENAQMLASVLKGIFPEKRVTLVFDSLNASSQVSEPSNFETFKTFVKDLESYASGDRFNFPTVDINSLPEKAQPFVKELIDFGGSISQEAYEEYAPSFKEALKELNIKIPSSLPLLADSLSYSSLEDTLLKIGKEKCLDSIVGTPSVIKLSRKDSEGFIRINDSLFIQE